MAQTTAPAEQHHARELVITRTLDAPRAQVFKAWTQPEHFVRWLGPKDFTCTSLTMAVQPGGAYRACIRSPDGQEYWMRGVYREVVAPERLVFSFSWEEDGERGLETLVTVELAEQQGKTRLTFRQAPFQSIAERDSHHGGWSECFDRLAAYLSVM